MASRRSRLVAAVVGATLLAGAYWAGNVIHDANVSSLRTAVYGECHRLNLLRITANRNNYSQYRLWEATITLMSYNGRQPTPADRDPQQAVLFGAFIAAMRTTLRTESWTPLSDCEHATDDPGSYRPPEAVAFYQRLPSLAAFTIGPNQ